MTDKERIEKEAIEYVIRATGYQVLSEHDHWKEAYIAGATAERQKVWNEAIDECNYQVNGPKTYKALSIKDFEKAVNENPELKYLKHRLRTEGKENQSLKLDLQKQKEEIEQLRAMIEKLLPLGEFLLNDTWDKRRLPANTHGIIAEANKLIKS